MDTILSNTYKFKILFSRVLDLDGCYETVHMWQCIQYLSRIVPFWYSLTSPAYARLENRQCYIIHFIISHIGHIIDLLGVSSKNNFKIKISQSNTALKLKKKKTTEVK